MLGNCDLVSFVPTTDLGRSCAFYGALLGLTTVGETPIAVLFDANGTLIRATLVNSLVPAPFTILGWSVEAIEDEIRYLGGRGLVNGVVEATLGAQTVKVHEYESPNT